MSTEENTGYISNWSERSTSCQRKKTLVTYRISSERSTSCTTEENTGYISNSSERSTSCQRKKTLVTYRIHQRGPHHVNGRKHWLHNEFIREVHIMSNGRKHWLHNEFIRMVHTMSTEENTGYLSIPSEWSIPCQRKKTLVTYRIHQRGPRHANGRKHWLHIEFNREVQFCFLPFDMVWTILMESISNQCFLPLTWIGPLCWIRYVTSVFFRWHDVDLSDEFDM